MEGSFSRINRPVSRYNYKIAYQALKEWMEIEQKLNDDLTRKPAHQKPLLQKQWQERLLAIEQLLNQ